VALGRNEWLERCMGDGGKRLALEGGNNRPEVDAAALLRVLQMLS